MTQTHVIETIAPPDVYLGPSAVHGRGVYAARDFKKNELIEECPAIFTNEDDKSLLDFNYEWEDKWVFPLGYGIFYNHSGCFLIVCYGIGDVKKWFFCQIISFFIKSGLLMFV